jgi:pimeloyl-ACP methyl ester carboxylesterase
MAVPPEHSRLLAESLPNAELKIIASAGHMANLEEPEHFNLALLEFLASIDPETPDGYSVVF